VKRGGGQRPVKIGEAGHKELEQKLKGDGFSDLKEAQQWLEERFGVHYSLSGVWYLIRVELGAKPKTGRARNVKQDPQEVEAFKKGLSEVADRKVWAEDEARFGLKTWHKRRWMAPGCRPNWVGEQRYRWFYLYGAIEPLSGRSLFWIMPDLTKESVKFFVEELRKEEEGEVALVWDQASAHRAMEGEAPEGITLGLPVV
jgi:hypothetical protein